MITKRPVSIGNKVILLGRKHIHYVDMKKKEVKCVSNFGEDRAE